MAFTALTSKEWGSSPVVDIDFAYDLQRAGANMQYKFQITINPLRYSSSYFSYPIYADISLDGVVRVSGYTLKAASPSTWSSDIVYTSGWLSVASKTSGTTALSIRIYSGSGNTRDVTYSYSLPVVEAASTVAASKGTLGTEQILTVTRYALILSHTITYTCGEATGTICTKSTETSISWAPPLSLAQQNIVGNSVVINLTVTTYEGTTKIGTTKTSFAATIPDSVTPTASLALSDPTGHKTTYGGYVQNQSQLTAKLTGTGAQGSTIKSYKIKVGSGTYSGSSTTVDLSASGDLTIQGTVTDSRTRTGSDSETITVLAYKSPRVTKLTVARCAADGTAQADGAYVKAIFTASITALNNKNSAGYVLQYRKEGTSSWTSITVTDAAGNYAPSNIAVIFAAATDSAFEIRVAATDDFGTVYSTLRTVTLAFVLLQTDTTGTGLAVGQQAVDPNTFAVGIPIQLNAGISKVATDKAASSRQALGIGKVLWVMDADGSPWSADNPTLTIDELQNYTMYLVGLEGHATGILAIRDGTYFRGVGAYDRGDAQQIYTVTARANGTTLTMESCIYARHFYSGSVGEAVAVGVNDIIGIF